MSAEKRFFVYARSGIRGPAFLLGPYETKEAADGHVDRGRDLARARDSWAVHYEFGVAGVPVEQAKTIKVLFPDDPDLERCFNGNHPRHPNGVCAGDGGRL